MRGLVDGRRLLREGRFVAFTSAATNLTAHHRAEPGATNVYVRDRLTRQTELISIGHQGRTGDGHSFAPAITPDGRYVAFVSRATNLTREYTFGAQIFVRDRWTNLTRLVSEPRRRIGDWQCYSPSIADDGQKVAYIATGELQCSRACQKWEEAWRARNPPILSRLVARERPVSCERICARARDGYVVVRDISGPRNVTTWVSLASHDRAFFGCQGAMLSGDGKSIVFDAKALDHLGSRTSQVYQARLTGPSRDPWALTHHDWPSTHPSVSRDGSRVVYSLGGSMVYWWNGVDHQQASVNSVGHRSNGRDYSPRISADGRTVVFLSNASNLTDVAALVDRVRARLRLRVYVRGLDGGNTRLVSLTHDGELANGQVSQPSISESGRYVTYTTSADNMVHPQQVVPLDRNERQDVILYDARQRASFRVSLGQQENEGDADSDMSAAAGVHAGSRREQDEKR